MSSYTTLAALGAPLTPEEYTRLANGPLAEILTFLSEHLVGRHAAATARHTLFLAQEAQAKSHLKQPATTRSRADKAVARLGSAKTSSTVHTTQLAELQEKTRTTSARLAALQRQLTAKRRLLLLLDVLEKKHTLRTQRIEALTRSIAQLKNTPPRLLPVPTPPAAAPASASSASSALTPRISHTRDRLADLRRLASADLTAQVAPDRLRQVVSRILVSTLDDSERSERDAARVVEACLAFARRHSHSKSKSKSDSHSSSKLDLDAKSRENKHKAERLQALVRRCAALASGCEGHLAGISTQTQTHTPSLRRLLQAEAHEAKGGVARLSASVVESASASSPSGGGEKQEREKHGKQKQDGKEEREDSFAVRVANACRMPEAATTRVLLEEVGRVVRRAHRRQRLLDAGALAVDADATTDTRAVPAPVPTHAHALDLLTRKAAKAELGRARAEEVEGVVDVWGRSWGWVVNDEDEREE
ncbi:hypothetical protein B0H19DRAFT_1264052 [Mycena capillaripes]|nr:hypothetical protein B0H19DRAFT_1264052 [Mycena capillaripes]